MGGLTVSVKFSMAVDHSIPRLGTRAVDAHTCKGVRCVLYSFQSRALSPC